MKHFSNHIVLIGALLIYVFMWILLHPYLGYLLDSDAVAYLTIAKRVASGQVSESINGLWSPLSSWILVPFLQNGIDAWMIAKILNFMSGASVIVLTHFMFIKFSVKQFTYAILMISLSIVMVYQVYFQMFGDVLQLIFILSYLLILWSQNFTSSFLKPILCGLLIAIGFYAKAYSLFFFFMHFAITLYWLYYNQKVEAKKAIIYYSLGVITSSIFVLPWTFALHQKYDVWSLSGLSGKLNMSWYINSGKSFNEDIKLLIPPTYSDSPSFWEDPYQSQDHLSGPFSSTKHFIKWMTRVVHTTLVTLTCLNEISYFAITILLIAFYYFFFRKNKLNVVSDFISIQLIILTIISLPLGYLMMHIETRYIWLNVILLMLLGALLLEQIREYLSSKIYHLSIVCFAISFLIFPVLSIENLKYKNRELFEQARILNQNNIKGSFTSNVTDAGRMWVLAYLSHNPFYTIERTDYTFEELIKEMKRYKVKYYVFESENNKSSIRLNETYFQFVLKTDGFDLYELK